MRDAAAGALRPSRVRTISAGRSPWELAALPALALTRLLPDTGGGLYLRLAAATLCLLVPGALIARALARPSVAAALGWSLAGLAAASAVMFAVHGSLWLALGLYAAVGVVALPFAVARHVGAPSPVAMGVAVAGVAFGVALWQVAGSLDGDALFHLARIRKLDAFGDLHLRTVDEFADGGLHPGYAFPLWHVFLALVGRVAGVDPAGALLHEASVLVPLAFVLAYEAGVAVFRFAWVGVAALLAQVAVIGLAAGHGGSYTTLALPATAARQLLVPAVIAVFFGFARSPSWSSGTTIAAASLALAFVHPTYALFVAIPLAGYAVARVLLVRRELGRVLAGLTFLAAPPGLVALWLLPLVRETASHNPSPEERARSLTHYATQLDVFSRTSFRLAPEVLSRTGAVAVAALLVIPLAGLASRRRWAALVLGGSIAVLALLEIAPLFTRFSDAVSLSQARRAGGFVPLAFAFAGGTAVLSRLLSWLVLPLALAAGIALQLAYPGDFGYRLGEGGPAVAAWIALVGGAGGLLVAIVLGRRGALDERGPLTALAAALFVLPVAVHGFSRWTAAPSQPSLLTAGLERVLADNVPKGAIVFSDDLTSYWVSAAAPVYVASALPGHVADTKANSPYARRRDAQRFGRTGDLEIPSRYHAAYVLVRRARWRLRLHVPVSYSDASYVLYRLSRL